MSMLADYAETPLLPSQFKERLVALCALRDSVNATNAPLEAELAKLNAKAEEYRVKAAEVASRIDETRGREKWIAMKREIRILTEATASRR